MDCIKFQTFKASNLVSSSAKKADYQISNTGDGSQQDMLKKLELSFDQFRQLKAHCDEIGIRFLSTPFDFDSIKFLNSIDMPFWKIPSGEITNYPFLVTLARTGKPIAMSTGMSTLQEVETAVQVLQENGAGPIKLLHCTTEYPTPYPDVNLSAIKTMRKHFRLEIGYSDHTPGMEVAIAAAAMGATIIEKHFTLDRNMEGPDHKASMEPADLAKMVRAIRHIELAMGSGEKMPCAAELANITAARKSIVASRPISCGEVFTEENITVKRPGNGISPMKWENVLGRHAKQDFLPDEMIVL